MRKVVKEVRRAWAWVEGMRGPMEDILPFFFVMLMMGGLEGDVRAR